jgi:hypothetical protein
MTASKKQVRRSNNRKSRRSNKKRGGSKNRKRGGDNEESSTLSSKISSKATELSPVEIREPDSETPETPLPSDTTVLPESESNESINSEGMEEIEVNEEEPKKAGLLAGFTHFFSWITGKSDSKIADAEAEFEEADEATESKESEEAEESKESEEAEEAKESEEAEESEEKSPLDTINLSSSENDDSLTPKPSLPILTKSAMGGKRAKRKKNKTRKVRKSRSKHTKGGKKI